MKALYVVLNYAVAKKFLGSDNGYALRPLTLAEIVAVEDRLFQQGQEHKIPEGVTTLIFPDVTTELDEWLTLAEFSLSLLSQSGHPSLSVMAVFTDGACNFARILNEQSTVVAGQKFAKSLNGRAVAQW